MFTERQEQDFALNQCFRERGLPPTAAGAIISHQVGAYGRTARVQAGVNRMR